MKVATLQILFFGGISYNELLKTDKIKLHKVSEGFFGWFRSPEIFFVTAGTSAEREFRPIMSPWYPDCKMFEQNYCGNLLVKQKRHLIYYRRNETDFECYLTNSTNPVVLQTFSSLLKIEKYTTETEREVVCNLHLNGDPASTYVYSKFKKRLQTQTSYKGSRHV